MGITGTQSFAIERVRNSVKTLKSHTNLPIAVGFGIKTKQHVSEITKIADAAIVGSAVVDVIEKSLDANGNGNAETVKDALALVQDLASGIRLKSKL